MLFTNLLGLPAENAGVGCRGTCSFCSSTTTTSQKEFESTPLGLLGASSSQHRRTPETDPKKGHASFWITSAPPVQIIAATGEVSSPLAFGDYKLRGNRIYFQATSYMALSGHFFTLRPLRKTHTPAETPAALSAYTPAAPTGAPRSQETGPPLGSSTRPMPRALWRSYGRGSFL